MNYLYTTMRKTVSSLLRRYGRRVTARRVVPGAYNPQTGRRDGDVTLTWQPLALMTGLNGEFLQLTGGGAGGTKQNGSRIKDGEMRILFECPAEQADQVGAQPAQLAQSGYRPQLGDTLILPGADTRVGLAGVTNAGPAFASDSERWVIVSMQPIAPAGQPLLYRAVIRRV